MSTPGEAVPAEPPVTPDETAAQTEAQAAEAAAAAQTDAIRELATAIAKQAVLDFDPATIRKGTIASIDTAGSPPTLGITISGDTTVITGVRYIDSYVPVVGDIVLVIKQGTDLTVLGQIALQFTASSWTDATLASGFSHGGNGGGNVRYRRVWDNGSWKMQWRGTAAITGTPTTVISAMPAGYVPASRCSVVAARNLDGNTATVTVEFAVDGTVTLTGGSSLAGPVNTSTTDTSGTTGTIGAHSHSVSDTGGTSQSHTHFAGPWTSGGTSQTHAHNDPQGGSTGGQNVSHTHDVGGTQTGGQTVSHTHAIGSTADAASHNHTITSTHNHTAQIPVIYPTWVSLSGIEYWLD